VDTPVEGVVERVWTAANALVGALVSARG
jgi:hypothetical protein